MGDGSAAELGPEARPLARLRAATFFVTGNHDHYSEAGWHSGDQGWRQTLESLGVTVLAGNHRLVPRGKALASFDHAGTFELPSS